MNWILDRKGLEGPITLDTKWGYINSFCNGEMSQFKRTQDSKEVVISCDVHGIHFVFNQAKILQQITVFSENKIYFEGVQIIGSNIDDVRKLLEEKNYFFEVEDSGLWCDEVNTLLVDIEGKVDGVEFYK